MSKMRRDIEPLLWNSGVEHPDVASQVYKALKVYAKEYKTHCEGARLPRMQRDGFSRTLGSAGRPATRM